MVEGIQVDGHDAALRRGAADVEGLGGIHHDRTGPLPHRSGGVGDDDVGPESFDHLTHRLVEDGVPGPVEGGLSRGLEDEARDRSHFRELRLVVPCWPGVRVRVMPFHVSASATGVTCSKPCPRIGLFISRLTEDGEVLGQEALGLGVEVIGVQVGDDQQLGSGHDLLGRTGEVHERIRRAAREGRPRVLRREIGVEEQLVPGIAEALRGVAEESEAHASMERMSPRPPSRCWMMEKSRL